MKKATSLLITFFFLSSSFLLAQGDSIPKLTIADTADYGGLDLYYLKGWRFSPTKPGKIMDGVNLKNSLPVDVFYGIKDLKTSSEWNGYGLFELEFVVDSALASRPWFLTYWEIAGANIWLNGKLVYKAGNPSETGEGEVLATPFVKNEPVVLRSGTNYLLSEISEHTAAYYMNQLQVKKNRMAITFRKPFSLPYQNLRAMLFGASVLLLVTLVILYGFLANSFREMDYHKYVLVTMFFFLLHAFFGLGDAVFNWTYSFIPIKETVYAFAFIIGLYFYLISIQKLFGFSVNRIWLHIYLASTILFLVYGLLFNYAAFSYIYGVSGIIGFSFGVNYLIKARKATSESSVGAIALGLSITMTGVLLYVVYSLFIDSTVFSVYVISVLMIYGGIPVSLTLNMALNYVSLMSSLDQKVKDRTAQLEESNTFRTRFFANISHEFRTPLTISRGLIQRLLSGSYSPGNPQNDLRTVERNMDRLKDMVDQIIDLTKADNAQLVLDLKVMEGDKLLVLLTETFRSLTESKHQELYVRPGANQVCIKADRARLEMMVNNLITNSIKFTPEFGEIIITSNTENGYYIISVEDNGPGIQEDQKEAIFERFHRIRSNEQDYVEGMGIGLELTRTLARAHNGDVYLEDREGTGSKFILKIPVSEHTVPDIEINEALIPSRSSLDVQGFFEEEKKEYNILLVEDNDDMSAYVKDILSEVGYVQRAGNGKEALDLINKEVPDIIITDLMMPVMNGIELVENLNQEKKLRKIPVIVLSARALEDDKLHLLRIGVVDYVTKPFLAEELLLKVRNLLYYYEKRRSLEIVIDQEELALSPGVIEKATAYVFENVSNANISPEMLAEFLEVSRRTLYRILELETGTTPAIFIREIRLATARKLLQSQKGIKLESLAKQVGYRNAKGFRKLYQERFGVHPLDEMRK
ncbi:MAG: response regulator [Balneola sp.]